MGLLKLGYALTFTIAGVSCYSPDLRDCTIACASEADCANGQICGADKLCAAPEVAGRCNMPGDAGLPNPGGGNSDARIDAPPDAATHAPVAISIEGKGRITVEGIGTCDDVAPQNGECVFVLQMHKSLTFTATAYPDWDFDRWTTAACGVESSSTCTVTPIAPTAVGVKFQKDD